MSSSRIENAVDGETSSNKLFVVAHFVSGKPLCPTLPEIVYTVRKESFKTSWQIVLVSIAVLFAERNSQAQSSFFRLTLPLEACGSNLQLTMNVLLGT